MISPELFGSRGFRLSGLMTIDFVLKVGIPKHCFLKLPAGFICVCDIASVIPYPSM